VVYTITTGRYVAKNSEKGGSRRIIWTRGTLTEGGTGTTG